MKTALGRRFSILALPLVTGTTSGGAAPEQATNQQTYRARTAVVSVNVSVRQGNKPVEGLRAEDFIVTDNGVRQTVDTVSYEAVPIDVSLVVDMSGSTLGNHTRFKTDVNEVAAVLRPADQLSIVTFGSMVAEVHEMQPANRPPAIDRLVPAGFTSLNSALVRPLVRVPVVGRRHLVVVFTDGIDTNSVVRGEAILEMARQSDSVMHVVFTKLAAPTGTLVGRLPVQRATEDMRRRLTEAARNTGGRSHDQGLFSGSLVNAFKQAFEQFRLSYVLTYRPLGVTPEGWHEIDVRVARSGASRIEARRGYFGGRQ